MEMDMNVDFNINDLGAKCLSKHELYRVLTNEGGYYLPPMQDATRRYLRDIMIGRKLFVRCKDVKVINVSHYKGLRIKDILSFSSSKINIEDYLPDYDYNKEPNRVWLCNIVNSLIEDEFKTYIAKKIKQRKQDLVHSQNLFLTVKPEILNLFKNSQSVSLEKGKSHFLTRIPKITSDQKLIEKLEEEKKELYRKEKLLEKEIDHLHGRIQEVMELRDNDEENIEKLDKLFRLGVIDENGNLIKNDMN